MLKPIDPKAIAQAFSNIAVRMRRVVYELNRIPDARFPINGGINRFLRTNTHLRGAKTNIIIRDFMRQQRIIQRYILAGKDMPSNDSHRLSLKAKFTSTNTNT